MNPRHALVMNTDDFYDLIRKQTLATSFPGFAARSSATGKFDVNPQTEAKAILATFEGYSIEMSRWAGGGEDHVLKRDDHLIRIDLDPGRVGLVVHSKKADAREVLDAALRRLAPFQHVEPDHDGIWTTFCFMSKDGVDQRSEFLRCPEWPEIRGNYPPAVVESLDALLGTPAPWSRGRLIVLHGPPGTGKTWAIRSLMMTWRDRFDFSVIIDPEHLARTPSYYYEVASESMESSRRLGRRRAHRDLDDFGLDEDEPKGEGLPRRRLFIMEDCADLIIPQSRGQHFDKIGKLLNMTDGLFGQGREDLFLVTFNEDIQEIDPAFLREGRCIANLQFSPFSPPDAAAWLQSKGVADEEPKADMTLAQLYGRAHNQAKNGLLHPASPKEVGFRRGRQR